MAAAHSEAYTLGLPIIDVERACELASRGIYQSLDTLIAGQFYDLVKVYRRFHDIFVVLKHNFLTEFKVILLPQRCHANLNTFLNIINDYHVQYSYFNYLGDTNVGEPVLLVDGGGFCQTL